VSKPAEAITSLGDGAFRLKRPDGTQSTAYAVADGARTWVFLNGATYLIEPSRRGRRTGTDDAAALSAPMPATVTQIHVVVGQPVTSGDLLITLEAMKMELPIRATTNAVVKRIDCQVGELVQPGAALIELGT
jgi:biotin carboxyl carrier protein